MTTDQKKKLAGIGHQLQKDFPCFRGWNKFNMQGRDLVQANFEESIALEYTGEVITDFGNRTKKLN